MALPATVTKDQPIMALSNPFRKKDGAINPIAIGIVVLLALIIAFGGSLAVSANRALGLVENARTAYSDARTSLEDGNFEEAYASARRALDNISALPKELEGPQWSIAAAIPVLGDDVRTAREMSSIAGKLANEAASPVFDQWDSITQTLAGDSEASITDQAGALLTAIPNFVETLAHAKQVIYECEEQTNKLPAAHISQLNDAIGNLKETMGAVGDMLRTFDGVVDALGSAGLLGDAPNVIRLVSLLGGESLPGLLEGLGPLLGL